MPGAGAGVVGAIVVAAGRGDRFGGPKQFLELAGVRLVDRAVTACTDVCDAVVVVLPPGVAWDGPAVHAAVRGGATRSDSVRAGLAALPTTVDVVVVHDAARPLASRAVFDAVIDAVRAGADAAVPGLPVADTLKRAEGDRSVATLSRDDVWQAQTPQMFRLAVLTDALKRTKDATDEASAIEAIGLRPKLVAGSAENIKVTHPDDFAIAEALLSRRVAA